MNNTLTLKTTPTGSEFSCTTEIEFASWLPIEKAILDIHHAAASSKTPSRPI